jgi:hypothetical protein
LLASDHSVFIGGIYKSNFGLILIDTTFISATGEESTIRRRKVADSEAWFDSVLQEIFSR